MNELIDLAVVVAHIHTRSYFTKSSLYPTKEAGSFIGKGGIEKAAGTDHIVKVGQAANLIDVLGVSCSCEYIGVIEQVKTTVEQAHIMRQGILQFWLSEGNIVDTIEHQSLSQSRNICKLIPHFVTEGELLALLELYTRFKVWQ